MTIRFAAQVGDAAFACGQSYPGIGTSGSTIRANDFRFFVSNVRLLKSDGTEVPVTLSSDGATQIENIALLDFENGTSGCAGTAIGTPGGTVPDGTREGGSWSSPGNLSPSLTASGMRCRPSVRETQNEQGPSQPERHMPHRVPAYRVQLVRDGSATAIRKRCETAREAVEVFRNYVGDADREHFVAMYLDNQDCFLGLNVVAIGTINLLHVAAREVFKPAILCNAVRLIVLHNHPSGEPAPSHEDLTLTRGLELAGMMLGIIVLDHVVVGSPGWVSLRETDQMLLTPDPEEELTPEEIDERMRRMLGFPARRHCRKAHGAQGGSSRASRARPSE